MGIRASLTQTCDLYAPTVGANGKQAFSGTASSSSVPCRVEALSRQVMKKNGTIGLADAMVMLGPDATVTRGYKLVSGSVNYLVEKVEPVRGLASLSHYELVCTEL